jgi:2-amino-4-hydroxy-6-hydroxymethyldihydropteridine diphosphokinase
LKRRYLIALGSNQRHARHGSPRQVLRAAIKTLLSAIDCKLEAASPIITSAPLGPSRRRYANAMVMVCSQYDPDALLAQLKLIEAGFGRRRGGQRWRARVLDLDIILWEGGAWASPGLTIPHAEFRLRPFVLTPAAAIAPRWRDPISGLSLAQLHSRLTQPRPLPKRRAW